MKTSVAIIVSVVTAALVTLTALSPGLDGAGAEPAQPAQDTKPVQGTRLARSLSSPLSSSASIKIPRIHLKADIDTRLNRGPAWWRVTGRPGGGDTVAIAGHRTMHTRPFYWLERIQPGDLIYIRWRGRVHAYRMSGRRILSATNLHIADARGHELLLLTTCTPRGSARQRLVVYAWPEAQKKRLRTS